VRFYLSQSGVRVPRAVFASLVSFVVVVLMVAMLPSDAFAAEPVATKGEKPEKVDARPDRVSAMSTAQQQGSRVEDLSARTPSSSTFANADGTWTVVATAGATRTQDEDGKWVDLDAAVVKSGDGYAQKAGAYDVTFSNGGDKTVGQLQSPTGASVGVGWPAKLPEPKVEGDTLTYPGAADGDDLVVTSLPEGFQYSIVLDQAPEAGAGPVEFRVPLKASGAEATVGKDGSVQVKEGKQLVASMSAPVMWDGAEANKDGNGKTLPVATEVDASADDPVLVLKPDMDFLTDPDTVYPVVVDPTVSSAVAVDTWVQSAGDTTSQRFSPELRVGSSDGGTTVARSYAYFYGAEFAVIHPTQLLSAKLEMSNFATGACTGSPLTLSRVTSAWDANAMTWATQPTVTSTGATSSSQSFGATGCAAEGIVSFDATQILRDWFGGATNWGVRIAADDETAASGWRKFRSQDSAAPLIPTLTATYNLAPDVPAESTVEPALPSGTTQVTSSPTPSFSTVVTDPDGGQVSAKFRLLQGSTTVDSSTIGPVPSGSRVYRKPTTDVPDGTYTAQWQADDGLATSAWSSPVTVLVDHTPPAAPTVACTNYAADSWTASPTATSTTCTVTAASGTTEILGTLNGDAAGFPALSGGTTSKSFTVPTNGLFDLQVTATDAAGNASSKRYLFGTGTGALTSPSNGARSVNQFTIGAVSKSGATSAQVQWRLAGNTTWIAATQVRVGFFPWLGVPSTQGSMAVTGDLNWNAAEETGALNPSAIEVRFCFNYTSSPTQRCTAVRDLGLVPHAFGGSFPTTDVGPASVSLMTGEFQLDEADVSVPGFGDDIGLSRTYQSFGVPASAAQGVFGPGWIANLDGPGEGFGAAQVIDRTSTNGTISLLDIDGEASIYKFKTGGKTAQAVGVYVGQGEAAGYNEKLELKAGTPKTLELTESDGTVTKWSYAGSNAWKVVSVTDPTAAPSTTYSYTTDNLVSGIYAGIPGVTCTEATQARGCHALLLTYTTIGSDKRLSQVDLRTWDPTAGSGSGAMTTTTVQKYTYDGSGKLTGAYDPRADTSSGHLTTTYTYQSVGGKTYLASATPPAEKTWNFNLNSNGTLDTVTRAQDPAIGGTATWRVMYDVPLSGSGLPDLTASAIDRWWQRAVPENATAVFGPDAPGTTDMKYADISYFTSSGQLANTASYGAGDWQIESYGYDAFGNQNWTLDSAGRALGLKLGWNRFAIYYMLSSQTKYNATGTRVEYEMGPLRNLVLENGTAQTGRTATSYVYDDEAAGEGISTPGRPTPSTNPDDPKPNVVVEERDFVTHWDGWPAHDDGVVWDVHKTRYRYDKVVGTDGDGWKLQTPTRTSVQLGSGWSTALTRFDTYGQVLETRTPQGVATLDGAGSDARSTINTYFTADASSSIAACRNHPEWLGLVCQTGPAASPGTIPTTTATGYDYLQNPTTVVESSGSMTRTTTNTYDQVGRKLTEAVDVTGAPSGDLPVATTTYAYSPANGALQSTSTSAGSADTTYDTWGRALTQTDGAGNTSTTTYDSAGRVKTQNDGKGTYTYTYDGNDATGRLERRGLVTKMTAGLASGPDEFKAAYDEAGNQTQVILPNGVVQDNKFDVTGEQIGIGYSRDGTSFLYESTFVDVDPRVRVEYSTVGYRSFDYDGRDRLVTVRDYVGGQGCITRSYGFSLDSNRTSLASAPAGSGGVCSTSSPVTQTSTFGADDTITNTGYTYDAFGRTRTVPAADTSQPTGGVLTAKYYGDEMVAKLSQTTAGVLSEKSYALDALGRIGETTSATAGVDLRQSVNHYDGGDDSPAWTLDKTRPNSSSGWTSTWTRNVAGIGGDLAIIEKSDGTSRIQLTNLHGDVVSTMNNTATGAAALENYTDTSEYGLTALGWPTLGQQYAWLGTKQRSGDTIGGLILMGVRLYNPTTGRFLTRDPVPGGNDNTYAYPTDPINMFDLDGEFGIPKKWKKKLGKVNWRKVGKLGIKIAGVGGAIACGASVVCGIAVGASAAAAHYTVAHAGKKGKNRFKLSGLIYETARGGAMGGLKTRVKFDSGRKLYSAIRGGKVQRIGKANMSIKRILRGGGAHKGAKPKLNARSYLKGWLTR